MPHRIRRQTWKVTVPDRDAAFAWRQALRARLDTDLLPALERAFSAAAAADQVVHIPRLTLHARVPDIDALVRRLPTLVGERLAEATRSDAAAGATSATEAASVAATVRDLDETWRAALLHYLAAGQLPWHRLRLERPTLLKHLHEQAQRLAATPAAWRPPPGDPAPARLAWLQRLLQLLPESARVRLLGQHPLIQPLPPVQLLAAWLCDHGALPEPARLALQALLLTLRTGAGGELPGALEEALAGRLLDDTLAPLLAAAPPTIAAVYAALAAARSAGAGSAAAVAGEPAATGTRHPNGVEPLPTLRPPERPDEQQAVQDAGLVLLHPFLPQLFTATGILRDDQRQPDPERLGRAAALLHWLATGRDEVFEFELGIVKPLLGLDPEAPLAVANGLLDAADREQGELLLAAVIGHWRALGHSSVHGLRLSFLQRPGLLRRVERGWELRVEPQAYDMLLAKLPWGIGVVKLPWMTKAIFTDWPAP